MQKLFYVFLFWLIIAAPSFSQLDSKINLLKEGIKTPYPIDGTMLLREEQQRVAEYLKNNPEELKNIRLNKASDWGFTVGSTKQWYSVNFSTGTYFLTAATCRAIGNRCYVFVEDSMWNSRVNQAAVDSIVEHFENKTPANPSKGIYDTDVETFGDVPDTDGDPRIVILILNIRDGFDGGSYVAGYYSSLNQTTNLFGSNKADMMYIDANPSNLNTPNGLENVLATFAHEFQHMIHWNYHPTDLTFMNEGASEVAEVICGYPMRIQNRYANETNRYLFSWRESTDENVLNDYQRASRFFLNLYDQFGASVFKPLVSSTTQGSPAIEEALTANGISKTFNEVFTNWLIANKLDDRNVNASYGYLYPNLQKVNSKNTYAGPVASDAALLDNLSANYYTFTGGTDLNINFTVEGNVIVKAIEIGDAQKNVIDVPVNTDFSVPNYGTTFHTVHFIVINLEQNIKRNYSFEAEQNASSIQELKWDETEPIGYFNSLSVSDTVCVTFDGVQGAKLDSIRIALRRAGSISGGIYEFTGNVRPTPLGTKLASVTASTSSTSPVPYPVPYENWTTIDLTSQDISADNPFAAAFVIGSDPTIPGVMIAEYESASPYHSFTYLNNPSSGSPDWYFLSTSETSIGIYLIRAYVSFNVTGVEKIIELAPADFSLSQNYPNPFNPSTKIKYSIPTPPSSSPLAKGRNEVGFVTLKVYDILGREITTLVNQEQSPGNYEVEFSGNGLPSGIYFYKLSAAPVGGQAGDFHQTRKMILLK